MGITESKNSNTRGGKANLDIAWDLDYEDAMEDYIDELSKCGWDNNAFDSVANKSKNNILTMALVAIERIIKPLQKKFPEVFTDIMDVIVGTREKLKSIERYKNGFDDKTR